MDEEQLRNEILSLKTEIRRLRKTLSALSGPLSVQLRRRGFRIYRKEPSEDVLLPARRHVDEYYRLLNRYSFRLFLRDVIKRQGGFTVRDVTRYATEGVTEEYVSLLRSIGLAGKQGRKGDCCRLKKPVKSFGPTLEWFLSEVLKREFGAEAIWGIKFKRPVVGGDYDLIAKLDGSLLYMEVKSSPPKQIYAGEVSAFLDRTLDLAPELAVFFMDTELRMRDKIVPLFEEELRKRPPGPLSSYLDGQRQASTSFPIERIEKELFQIENKIFIINAKESIVNNVEKVLSVYLRNAR